MTRHDLPGLRPMPLGSYLAGLGIVRLLGEQADPDLTAAWTDDGLVLDTTVDDLAAWLVEHYVPTPVLSPWNEGSGFGTKDKAPKQTLDTLVSNPDPRLDPFRVGMTAAVAVAQRYRSDKAWTKDRAVREFRNRCPDALLPWIDAAVVLAGNDTYFPPLLGTGGNDGRLDFSTNFHQRLLEVLDPKARQRALAQARDLISGTQVERLNSAAVGQFDPAAAGGRNSSPFGGADSIVNPWAFILLVEGALLFASTAVRRHQHAAGRAAMPFTVFESPDGSASGATGEKSRGEVWTPVWDKPLTVSEIRQLFAEARASWRGKPAQRAVEFYAATRTLGVVRGVDGFIRYGLHQRNGLAFVAVPIERVAVTDKPAVRLAARLEDWASWVRRGEASTAVGQAVRRFDAAYLAFARDGGALPLARLLATVTDLELAVGRSGRARDSVPARKPPPGQDFLAMLANLAAESAELRVAAGIASCATLAGRDPTRQPARTMRQILLPVDPGPRWRDTPLVAGFGLRPLRTVLADVLIWRARTAADEPPDRSGGAFRGVPTFRSGIPIPAGDLHAFATPGRLDEDLLDLWVRACLALRWDGIRPGWAGLGEEPLIPVPTLGLLHVFADGLPTDPRARRNATADVPSLALAPDWPLRLAAGRITEVHNEAVRRLRQAGWNAPALSHVPGNGIDVSAALVPRCRQPMRVLRRYLAIRIQTEETSTDQTPETPDTELVEEML